MIIRTDEQLGIPQSVEEQRVLLNELWAELTTQDDRLLLWFLERLADRTEESLNAHELEMIQRDHFNWPTKNTTGDLHRGSRARHDQILRELTILRLMARLATSAHIERDATAVAHAVHAAYSKKGGT